MDVLQCNDNPLIGRDVDAGNACHSLAPVTAFFGQKPQVLASDHPERRSQGEVGPASRGHNAETTPPLLPGSASPTSFLQTDAGYYWIPPPLVNLRGPQFPGLTPGRW